jgi:hypothetical protein
MLKEENMDYNTQIIYANNDNVSTIQPESQQRQIHTNKDNNCNEGENYSTDQNCIEKMYLFLDELGSGGFGKVIIDKKSIPVS